MMHSVGDVWLWLAFLLVVSVAFVADLGSLLRHPNTAPSLRNAFYRSMGWVGLALLFNAGFWWYLLMRDGSGVAHAKGLEFLTGYLLEKSLSVDNLFVILMVFQSFRIPPPLQRRVLLWGVLGACLLRFLMIFFGIWLVTYFHWLLYLFGLFIVWSGFHMLRQTAGEEDPRQNAIFQWVSRHIRVTPEFEGQHFFIYRNGLYWATPLFLALVLVEISDVIFAADSIPAIFAITLDPFIVFASNLFAILGLRSLYFLLAFAREKFESLQTGIALVLILIGFKMLAEPWLLLPVPWMLLLMLVILLASVVAGHILKKKRLP